MTQNMSMVEKVARAIAEAAPEAETFFYPYEKRQDQYDQIARAAIEAMREPTRAMVFFGMDAMARDDLEPTEEEFIAGYRGAFSAILNENGGDE